MEAMVLRRPGGPLVRERRPVPLPEPSGLRLRVEACAVCRTDLHVVDGELPDAASPIVPGHEIVGRVEAIGADVQGFAVGDRVGVPWLGATCGACAACRAGRENLCATARFTGHQIDGGYATHCVADARYCFPLPDALDPAHLAPLLCAGLIGHRALVMAGEAAHLGIFGFGAAAHIVCQVAVWQGRRVSAFTRPGDDAAQRFARELGAAWAGGADAAPPIPLDAAIIFAPVGALVPIALSHTVPGGTVVCAGIHMSDIPAFPYRLLWGERVLRSVANLTRQDAIDFLALAPRVPVRTDAHVYALGDANRALDDLRHGRFQGAAVLVPDPRQ